MVIFKEKELLVKKKKTIKHNVQQQNTIFRHKIEKSFRYPNGLKQM